MLAKLQPFDDNLDTPHAFYCVIDADGHVGELLVDPPTKLADGERAFGVAIQKLKVKARDMVRMENQRQMISAGLSEVTDFEKATEEQKARYLQIEHVGTRRLIAASIADWNYHKSGKPVKPSFEAVVEMTEELFEFIADAYAEVNTVKNSRGGSKTPLTEANETSESTTQSPPTT